MSTPNIIVHTANSVYGRHNLYGARSAHIARSREKFLPVTVYCRHSALEQASEDTTVRLVRLSPFHGVAYRILAAVGRKKERLRTEWMGFDAVLARRFRELAPGLVRLLHTWEWMPQSLGYLRAHHPNVIVVRDVTIARRYEYRSGEDILIENEQVDRFLSPSPFVTSRLTRWGVDQEKIIEIPFGVDTDLFRPAADGDDSPIRFAFSGALLARKGVLSLLRAWDRLRLSNAELHLYGNVYPEVRDSLEGARNVCVHGFVDLAQELPRNHVFVFPSALEGSSKSTYEALACGLPVVTTFNAGSVVRDGIEGLIVEVDDDQALAGAMDRLYRDGSLRAEMAAKARSRAEQFTWARYAKRIWDVYRNLIGADHIPEEIDKT